MLCVLEEDARIPVMAETDQYRSAAKQEASDYWSELSYLLQKHKPSTLAGALHLMSIVETYMTSRPNGNGVDNRRK